MKARAFIAVVSVPVLAPFAPGVSQAAESDAQVAECLSIPSDKGPSDLLFNPSGYQTYYERSRCFKELAVERRDVSLCDEVRERHSWFLDGSAFSESACRDAVSVQIRNDVLEAQSYVGRLHRIEGARVALNGNGRDFDFLLRSSGEHGQSHHLRLELFDGETMLGVLHENGYFLDAGGGELFVYIPRRNLLRLLQARPANVAYRVNVVLELSLWPHIRQYVAAGDRQTSRFLDVDFSRLVWQPAKFVEPSSATPQEYPSADQQQ